MNTNKKEELLIESIDSTISTTCKWIKKGLENPDSCLYPTDVIKALAELLNARASLENSFKEKIIHL